MREMRIQQSIVELVRWCAAILSPWHQRRAATASGTRWALDIGKNAWWTGYHMAIRNSCKTPVRGCVKLVLTLLTLMKYERVTQIQPSNEEIKNPSCYTTCYDSEMLVDTLHWLSKVGVGAGNRRITSHLNELLARVWVSRVSQVRKNR